MRIIVLAVLMCACQAAQDPENCQPPELNDGFFIPNSKSYKTGDKISYGCNTGLKPDLKTWWGEITCKNGEWSHTPRCINNTWCITTHVPNAKPDVLQAAAPGTHDFGCDYGYWIEGGKSIAECVAGSWTLPECKRNPDFCAPPPRVNNGMITTPYRNIFENGQTLEYICARGYRLDGVKFNTCRRGTWSSNPSCVEVKCTVQPYVAYARATERFKLSYSHGDTVRFICNDGYEFEGTDTARCEDGDWKLPVCKAHTMFLRKIGCGALLWLRTQLHPGVFFFAQNICVLERERVTNFVSTVGSQPECLFPPCSPPQLNNSGQNKSGAFQSHS